MAIIKCKMCGGDLALVEGQSVAECEYCGSRQTVPVADNEKKLTLFGRANRLRAACEFDKAAGIYESIVADFPEEAEAYWGLVLCKYGIEYVDDPATGKKIPTCHRSSFDSIMEDNDFEQALENADSVARKVYREEAKQIEEIRKGVIAVSANEQPYDIFICYKETDENGDRTLDSVLAQDVYDALTDKGYRVFFSRVTLEDKLGVEYEPYIFAALNSAKIMLTFGTDYEYINAVWVKNEWSRYLKLMAKDKTKHLIPCFKGIDAYDMPKEFVRLQAQDLGKVGAIQDLLRGIEKLLPRQTDAVKETLVIQQLAPSMPGIDSLLERAFMFLEDGAWANADAYCEKVLDINPKNAHAYLGKLMAELKIKKQDDLKDHVGHLMGNNNYEKALRFADRELQSMLQSLEAQYALWKKAEEDERKALEEQLVLKKKAEEDERKALEEQLVLKKKAEEDERKALEEQLVLKKRAEEQERRNNLRCTNYNHAIKLLEQGKTEEAYSLLKTLPGYKDADTLLESIRKDVLSVLALVKRNGKYGYINEAGKMVIPPQFDYARKFASNGLAYVRLNGKYGYINEAGEMVIEPRFDDTYGFDSNGLACVKRNGKMGYINEAGKMVIEPQFDCSGNFGSNGLVYVRRNGKYGYINEAGKMVIPPQFDYAGDFDSNGLAYVELNGKYGYINEAGKMVIPPRFDGTYGFAPDGLALVKLNGKFGYINEAGEMVIPSQFDDAASFDSNGLACVELDGKWGYINEAGEMVIPSQFDEAMDFASNGLACVELDGKWGYINEAGEMVIPSQFDEAMDFASNSLACVERNGKYGYINEAGEMVIPSQFDEAMDFASNGLACVERNGKYGYINEAGEMVIPSQFDEAMDFALIFRSEVEHRELLQETQPASWRNAGLCQHCGGQLKGLFGKKCVSCKKPKDY